VAFTYLAWLYVVAFCALLTAVVGQVVAEDSGWLGRLIRGHAHPD
jgi:membrane protein